jgi:hypothetical protein
VNECSHRRGPNPLIVGIVRDRPAITRLWRGGGELARASARRPMAARGRNSVAPHRVRKNSKKWGLRKTSIEWAELEFKVPSHGDLPKWNNLTAAGEVSDEIQAEDAERGYAPAARRCARATRAAGGVMRRGCCVAWCVWARSSQRSPPLRRWRLHHPLAATRCRMESVRRQLARASFTTLPAGVRCSAIASM